MSGFDLRRKKIVITGASAGLGKELATQLARDYQCDLVLVARRRDKLEALATQLKNDYSISVDVLVCDLGRVEDVMQLKDYILTNASSLQGVILNAGLTYYGRNKDLSVNQLQSILDVNVKSVVTLSNAIVQHYEHSLGEMHLLIVSSMAALFPAPYQAVYSGTKAFLLGYATAFQAEIKNPQISISVFAPGGMKTEMTEKGEFGDLGKWLMPISQAAKEAISGFRKEKLVQIPGWLNKVTTPFLKLMPRSFMTKQMAKVYEKSLVHFEQKNKTH